MIADIYCIIWCRGEGARVATQGQPQEPRVPPAAPPSEFRPPRPAAGRVPGGGAGARQEDRHGGKEKAQGIA